MIAFMTHFNLNAWIYILATNNLIHEHFEEHFLFRPQQWISSIENSYLVKSQLTQSLQAFSALPIVFHLLKHDNFPLVCVLRVERICWFIVVYIRNLIFSKLYSNRYLFKMSVLFLFKNSIFLLNSVFICWIVFIQFCFDCLHSCMYSYPILITCPYL